MPARDASSPDANELPAIGFSEQGVCHFSSLRNVSVGVWVGRATVEAARGLFSQGGQMHRRFPLGHSSISFICDKAPTPTPEAEELLKRSFGLGSNLACMVVILEGTGFWASALRSMVANMHRAGRSPVRLQLATSIDSVVGWFCDHHAQLTGTRFERDELRSALLRMRREGAELALRPRA